jgi:LacI family transcriptional regulator
MAKRRRVAIMLDLDWPYKRHHDVFAGTQEYARQRGRWECILDAYVEQSVEGGRSRPAYDGIIARVTPRLAQAARRASVPLVNVWVSSPVTDVPLVAPDFEAVGRMAARHLMARGFRQFGILGFIRQRAVKAQRTAFEATVAEAGCSCSSLMVPAGYAERPANWQAFRARIDEWIDSWTPPIGVSVSYDLLCRYLACACRRRGVHVPRDAALVGTHNEPLICAHPEPSLSSIELGYEQVGYRAAELLDEMMDGAPEPGEPVLLEPVALLPRRSSEALAVDDEMVAAALRFISEHSHEPIRVSHVAESLHVTRRTLERRFRAVLGRSIADEIARLRVERAKRRLAESKTSIKRLAVEAGFGDATQMCTVFKRVEGITPSDYRRQHRQA